LADLPEHASWSSRAWTDFAAMPEAERQRTPVVLPLFGWADWGLGRPLDLEEVVGSAVVREAWQAGPFAAGQPLLLPPLRFVLGPGAHTFFGVDFETAADLLGEIAHGVRAGGFGRWVLFNTSPWNREVAEIAACDARVQVGLRTFVVDMAALGLDLHPARSAGGRSAVQRAACACFGCLPDAVGGRADIELADFRPGNIRRPGPLLFEQPLDEAAAEGREILAAAGRRLHALLEEAAARPEAPESP
jgi:creatinine amidohydrolase